MAMKWREIMKFTPRDRKNFAEFVKVLRVKKGRDKNGFAVAMAETMSLVTPDGQLIKPNKRIKYLTTVTFIDADLNVRISCSCADFLYRWEVPLNKKGAAAIEYSNGQPTRVTNPASVPGQCVAKGSLVKTLRGTIPIEDVSLGDYVLTLEGYKKVTASALTRKDAEVFVFRLGQDLTRYLSVTSDHLVFAKKKNEENLSWVHAKDLCIGDFLTDVEKNLYEIKVIDFDVSDVYDLTVPGPEHFTANGFVVHNCKHLVALYRKLKSQYGQL